MQQEDELYFIVFNGTNRADIQSFTATNIDFGKEYSFKLQAMNDVGVSPFSPSLTTLAAVVPSVPKQFRATDSQLGSVALQWTTPNSDGGSPLTGFVIYYKPTGTGSWSTTSLIPTSTLYYQVSGLSTNTQYSFKITAANVKGQSE